MATPAGIWPCIVLDAFHGDNDKNALVVRINVELTDGPGKGTRFTYDEEVNNKQAPYIARTCKAVGWACRSLSTIKEDVAAWIERTGGRTTVEIKHIEVKRGKAYDKWVDGGMRGDPPVWIKAGSIGVGPKPLKAASRENLTDADAMLRDALMESGEALPPVDSDMGNAPAQTVDDDSIPF